MQEKTKHEISQLVDLKSVSENIAKLGRRMVQEVSTFAGTLLQMAERQDELEVAKDDLERAVGEVEHVNKMIEELQKQQREYMADTKAAREAYEKKTKELEDTFNKATADELKIFQTEIMNRLRVFEKAFSTQRKLYNAQLSVLIESIQSKRLGLREASMNQRSMLLPLFLDACDTMYYFSFYKCSVSDFPMLSDSFEKLLSALSDIKWTALTSTDHLPTLPTKFGDSSPVTIHVQDSITNITFPVSALKKSGLIRINLKDYDYLGYYDQVSFNDLYECPIPALNVFFP